MSSACVSCNSAPPPCSCNPSETCVQTSRNCTTCPQNICIPSATSSDSHSSSAALGGTIGGAVGGAAAGLLIIFFAWILYKRNLFSAILPAAFAPRQSGRNPLKSRRLFLKSSINPNHHLKPSTQAALATALSPNQQSVVYLPTAQSPHSALSVNPGHKSTSIDSHHPSDDDPFSDRNSGLSLTNQPTKRSSAPTQKPQPSELMPPTSQQSNLIPIAYIPPASSSISITNNPDDRTDAGPSPSTPTRTDHHKSLSTQLDLHDRAPTLDISNSNIRSSFLASNPGPLLTPPLPGNPIGPYKPVRPHRAPDLDLRLPTEAAPALASPTISIATTGPASSVGATIGPSTRQSLTGNADQLAPPLPAVSQFSRDSSSSEATHNRTWSQQSPLSLPASPSLTRHNIGSTDGMPAGSRLSFDSSQPTDIYRESVHRPLSSVSDATTHDSHLSSILDPAMIVTPVTLVRTASGRQAAVQRVALRGQEKARVVRLPPSSNVPHQPSPLSPVRDALEPPSSTGSPAETLGTLPTPGIGRFAPSLDNTRVSNASLGSDYAARRSQISPDQPSPLSAGLGEFDFESAVATVAGPAPQTGGNPFSDAAAVGPGGRVREGERRSVPGGRVGQLRMTRSSFGSSVDDSFMDEEVEFPMVLGRSGSVARQGAGGQQQMALKAIGRDRTISLSSMITAEASSSVGTGPVPPLPQGNLPEPFKPFAGQRPGGRGARKGEQTVSVASSGGLSTVSSIRSGYGSVLEGIPFNIEFNSEGDEFFGGPSSSRGSVRTESGSEMGEEEEDKHESDDGVGTVVGGKTGGEEGEETQRRNEDSSGLETDSERDSNTATATTDAGVAGGGAGKEGRKESEEFGREAMAAFAFVGE